MKKFYQNGWNFSDAPDPRRGGDCTHSMNSIIWACIDGLMTNKPSLRDVEKLTEEISKESIFRFYVPGRISDTTLFNEIQRMDVLYLTQKLVKQVLAMYRCKQFKPFGLPCGVATFDGKNAGTLSHDAHGTGHPRSTENKKWQKKAQKEGQDNDAYYLMPVIRVTLTSAEAKPCIYQKTIPVGTGESTTFRPTLDDVIEAYGHSDLFKIVDGDAGFTSLKNANYVTERGYDYVFGLKDNQPQLLNCAQQTIQYEHHLGRPQESQAEGDTGWECRNGKKIRRRLWRTDIVNGFQTSVGAWNHLTQVWLVRQETRQSIDKDKGKNKKKDKNNVKEEKLTIEDRYFLTSIPWDFLKAEQILLVVRNHWGIENDVFNSLDVQWREDHTPWCTQGYAIWVLGLLRLMAYNLVQYCRKRHLREKDPSGRRKAALPWRRIFDLFRDVIKTGLSAPKQELTTI